MKTTYYKSEHATVEVDEALTTVEITWKKFAKGDDYRKILESGLKALNEKGLKNWIGNLTEMKVITPEDQEWTNTVFFPEIIKTDLKKMAVVVSQDFYNKMSVESIMTKASAMIKFDTSYFKSLDEAKTWLKS